jgi:SH3-like domain-containing protein
MKTAGWRYLLLLAAVFPSATWALEFRSIAADRTVMYDAPSLQAKKKFLASRLYPVEVIVELADFVKVRDMAGDLLWVEKKNLSATRTALVSTPLADVLQKPEAGALLAFQAEKGVAFEILEKTSNGWLKVRHPDGSSGYLLASQVWGA